MTPLLLIIAVIGAVLTLWLVVIPIELVAGTVTAFRHGDRRAQGPKRP